MFTGQFFLTTSVKFKISMYIDTTHGMDEHAQEVQCHIQYLA